VNSGVPPSKGAVGDRSRDVRSIGIREIEVLALIARGASARQVGHRLAITPKTAETHIERIYAKTGASTWATATLFALQHGLLDTLEPFDSSGEFRTSPVTSLRTVTVRNRPIARFRPLPSP
jgi:DNA-binding CsgD family transcriptional regulator